MSFYSSFLIALKSLIIVIYILNIIHAHIYLKCALLIIFISQNVMGSTNNTAVFPFSTDRASVYLYDILDYPSNKYEHLN